ncbi:hypothetical protein HS088_TW08G00760 [Tripterygium wilfordii]|uniref:Uncharacterized protein n=1 Tax=Tripterygium wilfordii TaxID=458696 RepID=A0A7J7DCZ0_TRIWF|nr:hypothetical protein HS088_TW08G00760 [Tripterygium wilfordii]
MSFPPAIIPASQWVGMVCVNLGYTPMVMACSSGVYGSYQTLFFKVAGNFKEEKKSDTFMGKVCCSELSEGVGLDLMGLFMALVIALVLLTICVPPPRSRFVVYRVA